MNDKDLDINEKLAERLLDSEPDDAFPPAHTELAAMFSSLRSSSEGRVVEPTAAMTYLIETLTDNADDRGGVDAGLSAEITALRPAEPRLRRTQLALALVAACLTPILIFAVLSSRETRDNQVSLDVAQASDDGDADIAFTVPPRVRAETFLSSVTAGATQASDPFMACLTDPLVLDCKSLLDVDCVLGADAGVLTDDLIELDCLIVTNPTDRVPNLVSLTCARETTKFVEMGDYVFFGCVDTDPPTTSNDDIALLCATDAEDLPLYDVLLMVCQLEPV